MKRKLNQIIESILSRDGSGSFHSLIIPNHLAQMKLFGIRQGVEFVPVQDRNNLRKKKLDDITKFNKLDIWLERLWDLLLCKGKILFYLQPMGKTYKIYFFHKDQFRTYLSREGDLDEVVIAYSYKVRQRLDSTRNERWVKLWITKDEIKKLESDSPLTVDDSLDSNIMGALGSVNLNGMAGVEVYPNPLGWIPCVESSNYLIDNDEGDGEFSWIASHLEIQEELEEAVSENLTFFGNQTLIATRGLEELTEALGGREVDNRSFSSRSGFGGGSSRSSRTRYPGIADREKGVRIRKVVGNVQPEERFGYISPDPITGDHNVYVSARRESIRTALGGVDELGIHSGATAFEIKSIFGRAAATARKKCTHLYDYGICDILKKVIQAEEQVWKRGLQELLFDPEMAKSILSTVYPQADPKVLKSLIVALSEGMEISEDIVRAIADSGIELGLEGLPPLGDSRVTWRWTGPVFEESTQDSLNKSIVGRNMAEDGIDRWSVLRFIYPDKTDQELKEMTGSETSIPFRRIQQTGQAIGQVLNLYQQLSQMPHPYKPGMSLATDLDLLPSLQSIIEKLSKDVQHSRILEPASPIQSPTFNASDGANQLPSSSTATGAVGSSPSNGTTDSVRPYSTYFGYANPYSDPGDGAGSEPMAAGISRVGQLSESASLPLPGSTINSKSVRQQPISPVSFPSASVSAGAVPGESVSTKPIPPDMANQPGLVEQLFPTFSQVLPKSKRRSKSKRKK